LLEYEWWWLEDAEEMKTGGDGGGKGVGLLEILIRQQIWHRFDCLLQLDDERRLIEFI